MTEPRTTYRGNFKHLLTDIIFLVISAVICGANTWEKTEAFGKSQIDWLRKFVPLKNGIPSHDTISRVFALLNFEEFSRCFLGWIQEISTMTDGEVVAIDGKRICGSYDTFFGIKAVHMVSAFASENGLCLGQVACEEKSNEITAIPKLLELISIKGCTVTIDAMGCQSDIAEKIIENGADYILAVKENQNELCEQVDKMFNISQPSSSDISVDAGHGRVETRKCSVISDLRFFDVKDKWLGIKSVIKIESERFIKSENKTQNETRLYISSLDVNANIINKRVRQHWGIENKLHWMLDVNFGEDASRKRKGYSANNFNIISKIALTLVCQEKSEKGSVDTKRFNAALDCRFREKVLKI